MIYPDRSRRKYDWYFRTVPSKAATGTQNYSSVFIQIVCEGFDSHSDFGNVQFQDIDFDLKWSVLVDRAKRIIDALNADPGKAQAIKAGICANCDRAAPEGDFLCDICRAA